MYMQEGYCRPACDDDCCPPCDACGVVMQAITRECYEFLPACQRFSPLILWVIYP